MEFGQVYVEGFQLKNSANYFLNLFYVSGGIFSLKSAYFNRGTFNNFLYSSGGNLTLFDITIANFNFLDYGFSFNGIDILVQFRNLTFFQNIIVNKDLLLFQTVSNSKITLESLNFTLNNPTSTFSANLFTYIEYTYADNYIHFKNGKNNSIYFQEFLFVNQSNAGYFFS